MAFQRVVNKFASCGDVGDPKYERVHQNFVPEEDVRTVEDLGEIKKTKFGHCYTTKHQERSFTLCKTAPLVTPLR